jgi:dolichol-phosphate mannosyltransferase
MSPKVSLVLPTFNEKGNILSLVQEAHQYLLPWSHEIIVVDDHSPDGTYQAVVDARLPYARAILRTEDPSLAKSIRCGLEVAQGEVLIVMDSDFNHQPKDLPFLVSGLDSYDCVIGSRYLYGGSMPSMIRYRFSWLFNIFVRFSIGGAITDNLSGVFSIKRPVLQGLNFDKIFYGYGEYYIRFLYYLQKQKTSIVQFPSSYGVRGAGQGNTAFLKIFMKYTRATLILAGKARLGWIFPEKE